MMVVAGIVLVTGTIVTGTGPHAGDQHVKRLPFQLEDVARIHSLTVWAFLALTVATLVVLARTGAPRTVRPPRHGARGARSWRRARSATRSTSSASRRPWCWLHVTGAVAVWVATAAVPARAVRPSPHGPPVDARRHRPTARPPSPRDPASDLRDNGDRAARGPDDQSRRSRRTDPRRVGRPRPAVGGASCGTTRST